MIRGDLHLVDLTREEAVESGPGILDHVKHDAIDPGTVSRVLVPAVEYQTDPFPTFRQPIGTAADG